MGKAFVNIMGKLHRGSLKLNLGLAIINSWLNSLPTDKTLDLSKFKEFAGDKLNMIQKLKFLLDRLESIVEKGEDAGYQHFPLYLECFQKASLLGVLKSQDCVVKG